MLNRYLSLKFDGQVKSLLVAWDSWQLGMILFNLLTKKNPHINGKVTQDNLNSTREKMKQYVSSIIFLCEIFAFNELFGHV